MLSTIIIFLIVLSVLVIFHELGHFLAARKNKVRVLEFGIGFPPRALKLFKDKHGTIFSLNWLPFGGFCAMEGEGDPIEESVKKDAGTKETKGLEKATADKKEGSFTEKTVGQRLMIVLAGPIFSFLFGLLCFIVLYSVKGIPALYSGVRIKEVAPDSPAAMAGIKPETEITAVSLALPDTSPEVIPNNPDFSNLLDENSDKKLALSGADLTTQSFILFAAENRGQEIMITTTGPCEEKSDVCQERAQVFRVYIRTAEETPEGQGAMGLMFAEGYIRDLAWWKVPFYAVYYGVQQSIKLAGLIVQALANVLTNIFTGQAIGNEVAGPVGIVSAIEKEKLFDGGIWVIISFAGMLSINLAIMNILPIPAVDGGRAILIALEKIVPKKKLTKIEGILNVGGFFLLIGLMILITARDIWQIVMSG